MDDLDQPSDLPSSLYQARGEEISVFRPLSTGDVLGGMEIPGVEEPGPAVLIDHPCSMRRGPALRGHLLLARVVDRRTGPEGTWPAGGFFDLFPLPGLPCALDAPAIALDLVGRVPSSDVDVAGRIACLSSEAIALLWQRKIFRDARLRTPLAELGELIAPQYEEIELWENWCEDLVPGLVDGGMGENEAFGQAAADFAAFLDDDLRAALGDAHRRADVRRLVRTEIRRRK